MQTVQIARQIPSRDLTTTQLIQRCKALDPDPQIAYGLFVRERNLKPELSMNGFHRVFETVRPNHYVVVRSAAIEPTHFDTVTRLAVQVTETATCFQLVFANGMTGSEPTLAGRYIPLNNPFGEHIPDVGMVPS